MAKELEQQPSNCRAAAAADVAGGKRWCVGVGSHELAIDSELVEEARGINGEVVV